MAFFGREEHLSGVGGGGTFEAGTAGATRFGDGEVTSSTLSFVRVNTDPVQ